MVFQVEQSVPICLALSTAGGSIEVLSTAILAYQDAQEKEGAKWSRVARYAAFGANLLMQLSSSVIGNLLAPWFGPVSLVGPVFLSSGLLTNMVVFGVILGLEMFTKDMRVGTYIVVIAVVLLPIVGPTAQENQDVAALLRNWYSSLWAAIQVICMTSSCFLLIVLNASRLSEWKAILLLLTARATAFTVNLTVSKAMIMQVDSSVLGVLILLKVTSGVVITYALMVQSTAVTQAKFVPLNASALIIVNAMTGMIVWEDWRVVGNWVGYVCVFVQLVLGNYLLLGDVELLWPDNTHYGRAKSIVLANDMKPWAQHHILFDIDESDETDVPSLAKAASDDNKYMSISSPKSGRRRQKMRKSTHQEAWSSVYGLDPTHGVSSHRRHSIFAMDAATVSALEGASAEMDLA